MDPEFVLRWKKSSVRSTRNLVPLVQSKVLHGCGQVLERNMSQLFRTEHLVQKRSNRCGLLHSDGSVDVMTDTTLHETKCRQSNRSNKLGRE